MNKYEGFITRSRLAKAEDIVRRRYSDGKRVIIAGVIGAVKVRQLKNKSIMASATIEDTTGTVDVTIFSSAYTMYRPLLNSGEIVVLTAKISEREDRDVELICEKIDKIPEGAEKEPLKKIKSGLYLRVNSMKSEKFQSVKEVLSENRGDYPVIIVCSDTNKRFEVPDNLKVDKNGSAVKILSELLGEENVKLI